MNRTELREKMAEVIRHARTNALMTDAGEKNVEYEVGVLDHLIDEWTAGVIPEKKDIKNPVDKATMRWWQTHGYNQAIDEISRRAGIGEKE